MRARPQGLSLRYRLAWIALWLLVLGTLALGGGGDRAGSSPPASCPEPCRQAAQAHDDAISPVAGAAMP